MKRVGILGGGQLGMLLANSIFRLGGDVHVFDPDPQAPACRHVKQSVNSPWMNFDALSYFFDLCDVITWEFENVESAALVALESVKPIHPSLKVLKTSQDRALEKKFMLSHGLPHANFMLAETSGHLRMHADHTNYPCIIKTARGGYDGKGQFAARNRQEFLDILDGPDNYWLETFSGVIEETIDLAAEVSCIVARPPIGEPVTFPVFENIHKEHILDMTICPARIPLNVQNKISEIALDAAKKMNVVGLLTVEFFLSKTKSATSVGIECDGWYIYINEFAPRPHNSGHVSMNACSMSQFDALARILLDVPLSKPWLVSEGTFCMTNLLGDVWLAQSATIEGANLDLRSLEDHPQVIDVVIYGKREPRSKRKMGHFVTYGETAESAVNAAHKFKESLTSRTMSRA